MEKHDPNYEKERFEALKTEVAALKIKIADVYAGAGLTNKMEMLILLSLREKIIQTTDPRFKYFLANGLTRQDYDKFIGLNRTHAGEEIPDITIDGKDMGYPGYYLKKIPVVTDADFAAKAAVLGKLTGCCQSLSGEAGEPCAIYGLTSPHSGFYMICKGDVDHPKQEDELLAQTWVWRSQTGAIVFDSVERSSEVERNEEELKKVKEMINYLAFKLAQEDSIPKVTVGRGSGISTSFGEASYADQERFIDYTSYTDAGDQAVVVGKESQFLLLGKVGNKDEEVAEAFRKWLGNELANKDIPLEKNQNILNMINLLINHPNERVKQIIDTVISGTEHKEKYEGTQKLVREYLSLLELLNNNEISAADFLSKVPSMEPAVISLKTKDGYTVAQSAARLGYGELLKLVIEKNPEVILEKDALGKTLAHLAAENGFTETLNLMIEKNPEVVLEKDDFGQTPAHYAAEKGLEEALKLMIEKQPEVILEKDGLDKTPAHYAAEKGYIEALKLMIKENPEVILVKDQHGQTPAHLAAIMGHAEVLKWMIKERPEVILEKDIFSYTPAHWATKKGHIEALKLMIEKNPKVILEKDNSGQTLAHWAAETWGDVDVLKLVIEKQPEVILEKDNSGSTPVHWAIENGNIDALELMIEKQPEVISVKDNDGNTVLSSRMDHIFKGSEEDIACARMLIENGADFSSLEEKARLTGKSLPPEILDAIEEKRVANEA